MTPEQTIAALKRYRQQLPLIIGQTVVSFALDNWDRQGFQGAGFTPWEPTKEPRNGRAILVGKQSGRLRRSVRITRALPGNVQAGSDLDYAAIHNTGGIITVPVTAKSRKFFWAMYYATKDERWRGMALTKRGSFKINMPKRQFIGDSPELDKRMKRAIEAPLKRIFQ